MKRLKQGIAVMMSIVMAFALSIPTPALADESRLQVAQVSYDPTASGNNDV